MNILLFIINKESKRNFKGILVLIFLYSAHLFNIIKLGDILLLIIIVFFLKMTDNTIRKLRNRRPPPYLLGDVNKLLSKSSDPELFGYARSNYPKVPILLCRTLCLLLNN